MSFEDALIRLNKRLFEIQKNELYVDYVYDIEYDSIFQLEIELQQSVSDRNIQAITALLQKIDSIIDSNLKDFIVFDEYLPSTARLLLYVDENDRPYVDIIMEELSFYKNQLTIFLHQSIKPGDKVAFKSLNQKEKIPVNISITHFGILIGLFFKLGILKKNQVKRTELIKFFAENFSSSIEQQDLISASALNNSSYSAKGSEKKSFSNFLDSLKNALEDFPTEDITKSEKFKKRIERLKKLSEGRS